MIHWFNNFMDSMLIQRQWWVLSECWWQHRVANRLSPTTLLKNFRIYGKSKQNCLWFINWLDLGWRNIIIMSTILIWGSCIKRQGRIITLHNANFKKSTGKSLSRLATDDKIFSVVLHGGWNIHYEEHAWCLILKKFTAENENSEQLLKIIWTRRIYKKCRIRYCKIWWSYPLYNQLIQRKGHRISSTQLNKVKLAWSYR